MNKKAFSIIEVLVGIFIFSMGIVSVFSLIINTLNLNEYNKNYIIATNLSREQIELFRNIRDSNYKKIQVWSQIDPSSEDRSNLFTANTHYKIENDFSNNVSFPVKMTKIENFGEGVEEINNKMNNYRLCIDTTSNLYVYCCDAYDSTNRPERCSGTYNEEKTFFYRYIKLEEVPSVSPAFKVTSKVIWYSKGYKEFEINSIFTDFKRF